MLRYLTAGEAHGPALIGILDGFPAGVPIDREYVARSLARRRTAAGRSRRQARETDSFYISCGVYKNTTTGAPVAVMLKNVSQFAVLDPSAIPRPGHADLAGMLKYGISAAAVIRERASARETAVRTALGAFCLRLLELLEIKIFSRVVKLGHLRSEDAKTIMRELEAAARAGRSLGGVFEIRAENLPVGLGSHAQWDRRLPSRLAAQLMGLNGVKGLEFGSGFELSAMKGEEALDFFRKGSPLRRLTNLAGGLEGGMTNGMPLVLRAAVRPVPGQRIAVRSIDLKTGKTVSAAPGRSDVTAVFASAVIAEHLLAFELAGAVLEKFGGDSLKEIRARVEAWRKQTKKLLRG
jgi:chorismate synthase